MGIEKFRRGVVAPSFTPAASGIPLTALAHGTDGNLIIERTGLASRSRAVTGDITIDLNGLTAIGANKVLSSMMDLKLIQFVSVPISSANILAMFGAPVSVLATPGAGKYLQLIQAVLEMTRTGTAYANGGVVQLQYHTTTTSVPHAGGVAASIITTGGAGLAITGLGPNVGSSGLVIPVNEGLDITNLSGAFITGTGTAILKMWYRIVTAG